MDQKLFESVDQYIADLFSDEDDALKAVEPSLVKANIPQISISPNQGKFLQILARLCHAKKILEIGLLGGYSTIWMARALPPGGKLISLELDPNYAKVARENLVRAGVDTVVEIRLGKAIDSLEKLAREGSGPFDMIFIDADKPPYTEYFQWALKLSRPGTLIVADNIIRAGKAMDTNTDDPMVQGVQRFNKMLSENKAVTATLIQTVGVKEHDGMAIAVVK